MLDHPSRLEKRDKEWRLHRDGRAQPADAPWADGTCIKPSEATSRLGFKFFEVYASTLQINARAVEAALQKLKQALPLGTRLWRCPDMGPKYDKRLMAICIRSTSPSRHSSRDMVHTGEIIINE